MANPLEAIRQLVLVQPWGSIRSALLLVGLVIAIFAAFGTAQGPGVQPPIPAAAKLQQAPGEAGLRAHGATSNLSGSRARERPVVTPRFIDPGQRITVPQSSRLRNELIIGAVAAREIRRTLEVPGVVEADPARTVKVLPPVAGRVIDLKVQLGDRVAQQQELAVIYVGDLARARRIGFEGIGNGTASVGQQAAARLEQPAAQLRALGGPVDGIQETRLLSVRAPVAGSVIDLRIAPGAVIDELSVSMMTIANLDTILVAANVSKRETENQHRHQHQHRRNRHHRLRRHRLTFFGPKETVSMVPISALVPTYAIDLVFVEVEPWIFEARAVGVGLLEDSQDIVANGLKIGDRVVVGGGGLLLRSQAQ
jgi:membrane fusion protein, heavy metal efflux system